MMTLSAVWMRCCAWLVRRWPVTGAPEGRGAPSLAAGAVGRRAPRWRPVGHEFLIILGALPRRCECRRLWIRLHMQHAQLLRLPRRSANLGLAPVGRL